jgi:voltage-gated potassium channel
VEAWSSARGPSDAKPMIRRWNRRPSQDAPVVGLILFRLRWAILALLTLALVATVGYVVIEKYGWIDALYMTVITLGTIGYGEVHPLNTAGRMLTIAVIILSFTTFVYAVSVLTNLFVSGEALDQLHHRRSKKMREELDHHVIVVGFGRVGQAVVRGLGELGKQCVVLDRNRSSEAAIRAAGGVEVIGDATNQEDLRKAGIDRADALIAACDADSENLVVVLTARSTRSDLRIVSRVNEAAWHERIQHAGADVAQSPYPSYGMNLAAASVSSAVLDLHDLPLLGLGTEEIEIPEGSPLNGSTAAEILQAHPCVYVIGLRRDARLQPWHAIEGVVKSGDVLVALGAPEYLVALAAAASPAAMERG